HAVKRYSLPDLVTFRVTKFGGGDSLALGRAKDFVFAYNLNDLME
ncbi:446_t:CDS:2, partial [Paraglomus brasilianum]